MLPVVALCQHWLQTPTSRWTNMVALILGGSRRKHLKRDACLLIGLVTLHVYCGKHRDISKFLLPSVADIVLYWTYIKKLTQSQSFTLRIPPSQKLFDQLLTTLAQPLYSVAQCTLIILVT